MSVESAVEREEGGRRPSDAVEMADGGRRRSDAMEMDGDGARTAVVENVAARWSRWTML
jgi:hypothetical protein